MSDSSKLNDMFKQAIESMYYTMVTDDKGVILCVSKNYRELLGLEENEILGKNISKIIPNSRVPQVLKSGKEEIGYLFEMSNGETVVCNRIPIKIDGIVKGIITTATFYDIDRVEKLNKEIEKLKLENLRYKEQLKTVKEDIMDRIIGCSEPIIKIKETIEKVASSNLSVLITGETGVGKEVFANAIHQLSNRRSHKFIKINCAAIPKELLESELFGYEPGAFSGASKNGKMGKFELANYGTILLDEIGEMPLYLQSKLLRVLQERELERVGGIHTVKLDIRVICSTNQNLEELIAKGLFRQDLYYRINVVELKIPPLRDRKDEILPLCEFFIDKINYANGLGVTGINHKVLELFQDYNWVGNVRELEHTLERACVITGSGELKLEHFDFLLARIYQNNEVENSLPEFKDVSLENTRNRAEKVKIMEVLISTKGNKTAAAKILGIDRSALYSKLKKYNMIKSHKQ
ncbi:sigma-54-dependent Fis family transcriptional regulator [Clostridium beijerinckii]|nr:sigma-54-dependent Fis family transcriptional regulator [Clostridium beijerinckii]